MINYAMMEIKPSKKCSYKSTGILSMFLLFSSSVVEWIELNAMSLKKINKAQLYWR